MLLPFTVAFLSLSISLCDAIRQQKMLRILVKLQTTNLPLAVRRGDEGNRTVFPEKTSIQHGKQSFLILLDQDGGILLCRALQSPGRTVLAPLIMETVAKTKIVLVEKIKLDKCDRRQPGFNN
jgi:hypothetical protein